MLLLWIIIIIIISLFSQNMQKIHKTNMFRRKIAKRPKEARQGLSPNRPTQEKNTFNLPTKESNKKKQIKLTLPIPSKPSMKWNQHHISTPLSTLQHTPHTHSHRNQETSKTSQAPRMKKRYIITLLRRNYVVFQLLSKCLNIEGQFNFFRWSISKTRSRCFHSFGCKICSVFSSNYNWSYFLLSR